MTLETQDGKTVVKRVKGLVFVAQSYDRKNHTVSGSVGTGGELARTMSVAGEAIKEVREQFMKEAISKLPSDISGDLKKMADKIMSSNKQSSTEKSKDVAYDGPGEDPLLKRQKIIN